MDIQLYWGRQVSAGSGQIFDHHPWTVASLVQGVSDGSIRLPDIQRPFVWRNAKVRDLIDSMYRGYPVGELMFWKSRDETHAQVIGSHEVAGHQDVSYQVVDGQQRLTSLFAAMRGVEVYRADYSRERIRIAFNPLTERFEVPTATTERSAEWINDMREIFVDQIAARRTYLQRLEAHTEHPVTDFHFQDRVERALARLAAVADYQFQVVQVHERADRELVADIFVRTNSEGVSLSSADFILTWLSVFWEDGRRQLDEWSRRSRMTPTTASAHESQKVSWTPHSAFMEWDPDQLLRVAIAVGLRRGRLENAYNVLRGRNSRTREIEPEERDKQLARLKAGQSVVLKPSHWDEFLRVLERAGFRSGKMISSKIALLYTYSLWLIGRTQFQVPVDELREVMARWFFMSLITYRYTGSYETRIQEDMSRLEGLDESPASFVSTLNSQIAAAVPPDWWTFTLPGELETSAADGPAYSAYIAALNILDAEVLLSTSKMREWTDSRAVVKGIEKHHLFPKAYLKNVLRVQETKRINQVANMAMVEWSDNIDISDAAPEDYWQSEVAKKGMDTARVRRQMEWHALPANWTGMAYADFLSERRRLIAHVIHEGFKRLTDPNYVPDLTRPVDQNGGSRVLPSLETLIATGAIEAGTTLVPVDGESEAFAEVMEDGSVQVNGRLFENLDLAARDVDAEAPSGWRFWAVASDEAEQREPLAVLRNRAATVHTAPGV